MAKLLKKENNSEHADRAAKIIQDALGIAFADVPNYVFPRT
jgi:hypothetical protein